jgi:hypothetical protein
LVSVCVFGDDVGLVLDFLRSSCVRVCTGVCGFGFVWVLCECVGLMIWVMLFGLGVVLIWVMFWFGDVGSG